MEKIKYEIGTKILFNKQPAVIIKIIDLTSITIQLLEKNIIHTVKESQIKAYPLDESFECNRNINLLTDEQWEKVRERFNIIEPILKNKKNSKIKQIAKKNKIHFTTVYRWLKNYEETGVITSLIGNKKNGGRGKSRLDSYLDIIINDEINTTYLSPSKKSISKTIRNIIMKCKSEKIKPPHPNTIRNRIKNLSEETVLKSRYGKSVARDKFEPIKKHFPGADYPLSVVQIDHTLLDIILVDEHYRKPFLRPYLTLAIDVFSRMVVGFYLSFDPPGELGTGLCIANSIMSKEMWLEKYDINADWPSWGVMNTIHLDNAKEFRGNMLRRACENYGINIEYRPVATPHWGGHVERLLGTFSKEIHNLSGSTFSNISDRKNYDSVSKASLTINELEKWLLTLIVNVYHNQRHSSIKMTPLQKYEEGILGNNGIGLPPKLTNERRLKLDFMPFFERTVQEYGVVINHINYYDDILRKYIHTKVDFTKNSNKKKFIFKRDPRDISIIYFYDESLNEYFEVPYRNTSQPPMSIWEYNQVLKTLNKQNIPIDEDAIFSAYKTLDEIEMNAISETKRLKRFSRYADKRNETVHKKKKIKEADIKTVIKVEKTNIKPFDFDDDAFAF